MSAVRPGALQREIFGRSFEPRVERDLEQLRELRGKAVARPLLAMKPPGHDTRIRAEPSSELVLRPAESTECADEENASQREEATNALEPDNLTHATEILSLDTTVNRNNYGPNKGPVALEEVRRQPRPQGDSATEFGRRIRLAREDADMSQNALNAQCGFEPGYINRLELGTRGKRPTSSTVNALVAVLKVRADWLLRGVPPMRELGTEKPDPKLMTTTRDVAISKWRNKKPPIPEEVVTRVLRTYVGPEFLKRDEDFWNAVIEAEAQSFLRELAASLAPRSPAPPNPPEPFTGNDPSPTQVGAPPKPSERKPRARVRKRTA